MTAKEREQAVLSHIEQAYCLTEPATYCAERLIDVYYELHPDRSIRRFEVVHFLEERRKDHARQNQE